MWAGFPSCLQFNKYIGKKWKGHHDCSYEAVIISVPNSGKDNYF